MLSVSLPGRYFSGGYHSFSNWTTLLQVIPTGVQKSTAFFAIIFSVCSLWVLMKAPALRVNRRDASEWVMSSMPSSLPRPWTTLS